MSDTQPFSACFVRICTRKGLRVNQEFVSALKALEGRASGSSRGSVERIAFGTGRSIDHKQRLDGETCIALFAALESDPLHVENLQILNIANNDIGDTGCGAISHFLFQRTCRLSSLVLDYNKITAEGALFLGQALRRNHTLTVFSLVGNELKTEGAGYILRALSSNASLSTLDLSANAIGDCMRDLKTMLERNSTLQSLSLDSNFLGRDGCFAGLVSALRINETLRRLDVAGNSITEEDSRFLVQALKENNSLIHLDVSRNFIPKGHQQQLEDCLYRNQLLLSGHELPQFSPPKGVLGASSSGSSHSPHRRRVATDVGSDTTRSTEDSELLLCGSGGRMGQPKGEGVSRVEGLSSRLDAPGPVKPSQLEHADAEEIRRLRKELHRLRKEAGHRHGDGAERVRSSSSVRPKRARKKKPKATYTTTSSSTSTSTSVVDNEQSSGPPPLSPRELLRRNRENAIPRSARGVTSDRKSSPPPRSYELKVPKFDAAKAQSRPKTLNESPVDDEVTSFLRRLDARTVEIDRTKAALERRRRESWEEVEEDEELNRIRHRAQEALFLPQFRDEMNRSPSPLPAPEVEARLLRMLSLERKSASRSPGAGQQISDSCGSSEPPPHLCVVPPSPAPEQEYLPTPRAQREGDEKGVATSRRSVHLSTDSANNSSNQSSVKSRRDGEEHIVDGGGKESDEPKDGKEEEEEEEEEEEADDVPAHSPLHLQRRREESPPVSILVSPTSKPRIPRHPMPSHRPEQQAPSQPLQIQSVASDSSRGGLPVPERQQAVAPPLGQDLEPPSQDTPGASPRHERQTLDLVPQQQRNLSPQSSNAEPDRLKELASNAPPPVPSSPRSPHRRRKSLSAGPEVADPLSLQSLSQMDGVESEWIDMFDDEDDGEGPQIAAKVRECVRRNIKRGSVAFKVWLVRRPDAEDETQELGEDYFLEDVEGGVFGECAVGNLRRLRIDVGRVCLQVSKKRKLGIFGSGWTTLWQRSFSPAAEFIPLTVPNALFVCMDRKAKAILEFKSSQKAMQALFTLRAYNTLHCQESQRIQVGQAMYKPPPLKRVSPEHISQFLRAQQLTSSRSMRTRSGLPTDFHPKDSRKGSVGSEVEFRKFQGKSSSRLDLYDAGYVESDLASSASSTLQGPLPPVEGAVGGDLLRKPSRMPRLASSLSAYSLGPSVGSLFKSTSVRNLDSASADQLLGGEGVEEIRIVELDRDELVVLFRAHPHLLRHIEPSELKGSDLELYFDSVVTRKDIRTTVRRRVDIGDWSCGLRVRQLSYRSGSQETRMKDSADLGVEEVHRPALHFQPDGNLSVGRFEVSVKAPMDPSLRAFVGKGSGRSRSSRSSQTLHLNMKYTRSFHVMQNGRLLSLKLETADAAADKMGLGKPGNEEGAIPLEESCVLEFPNVLEATAAAWTIRFLKEYQCRALEEMRGLPPHESSLAMIAARFQQRQLEVAARVREEEGMREQFQAQKQQEELLRSMSTMMLQAFQQQQQQPQPGMLSTGPSGAIGRPPLHSALSSPEGIAMGDMSPQRAVHFHVQREEALAEQVGEARETVEDARERLSRFREEGQQNLSAKEKVETLSKLESELRTAIDDLKRVHELYLKEREARHSAEEKILEVRRLQEEAERRTQVVEAELEAERLHAQREREKREREKKSIEEASSYLRTVFQKMGSKVHLEGSRP